jgi:hypothetical protein
MHRLITAILLSGVLCAQTPVVESKDPLGRNTPQDSVFHFLEACHARDYSKALYYLDLRRMPPADRVKQGPNLARQLEDLLDDTPFEITTLSRDQNGDQSDGLSPACYLSRRRTDFGAAAGASRVEARVPHLARLVRQRGDDSKSTSGCGRNSV